MKSLKRILLLISFCMCLAACADGEGQEDTLTGEPIQYEEGSEEGSVTRTSDHAGGSEAQAENEGNASDADNEGNASTSDHAGKRQRFPPERKANILSWRNMS